MNNILAIDPGTEKSAYVFYSSGRLTDKGIVDNKQILNRMYEGVISLVSIEMIASYGMPVGKDTFETVMWIGRFIQEAVSIQLKCTRVYRKEIKMHICNSTAAKDSNIRQALIDKYGKPGTKKAPNKFYNDSEKKVIKDIWSALAVLDYTISRNIHEIPLEA